MNSTQLPEPWRAALEPKGLHSFRDVAARVGGSHETIRRLMTGGRTSASTVNKVADALFSGDRSKVWEMYGLRRTAGSDFTLPPEASLLEEDQRAAVLAVVRAMLPREQRVGEEHEDGSAPIGPPPLHPRLSVAAKRTSRRLRKPDQ